MKDTTVLDAVEAVLGAKPIGRDLAKLTLAELDEIAGSLNEFWGAQASEPVTGGASLIGGWHSAYGTEPSLREDLSDSLLYYPTLLMLDPLADFFNDRLALPRSKGIRYRRPDGVYNTIQADASILSRAGTYEAFREDPGAAAARFAKIVSNLYALEGPIREGVTVLRSQWPILAERRAQLETAVRHDVDSQELQEFIDSISPQEIGLTAWDNLQGIAISADGPIHAADAKWRNGPFFYYLDKMLAVADAYDAKFVPPTRQDLAFLRIKVGGVLHRMHPGAMLREVSDFALPSIEAPIREAIAVRKSSEYFEEWRGALRSIERDASADSPEDLRERVEDELRPRLNRVRRELETSSIKHQVKSNGADFVIDAAVGVALALGTREALWGVGATATTGILHWIHCAYTRAKPTGADAVLATLLRDPK